MRKKTSQIAVAAALALVSLTALANSSDIISKTEVKEGKETITLLKYWQEPGIVCQQYVKAVKSTVSDAGVQTDVELGEICDRPTLSGRGMVDVSPAKLVAFEVVRVSDGEIHLPVLRGN